MPNKSIAIVGGGIAGNVLCWTAHFRGYQVEMFNKEKEITPSKVAAGVINPVAISRKKLIYKGGDFARSAWIFFNAIPNSEKFVYQTAIQVPFKNIREQNDWSSSIVAENGYVETNLDVATIPLSGWIDTEGFMANKPLSRFRYNQEEVNDIMLLKDKYDIVFCATGLLPDYLSEIYRNDMYRPVLGDVLIVELEQNWPFTHLEGLFLIPLQNGKYYLGSTYVKNFTSAAPSLDRANGLLEKARLQGVKVSKMISYTSAVRPATFDRSPLVGNISDNIYSFTGMGSRALLHAPLLANQIFNKIEYSGEIFEKMNIKRALKV